MKKEQNTAKEVLNAKKSKEKSASTKLKESIERTKQNYFSEKDNEVKKRLLSMIRVHEPDFTGK